MAEVNKRIAIIIIAFTLFGYIAWYLLNWYWAGTVSQAKLIEFNMQEDFSYCQKWRPELFDKDLIKNN